MDLKRGLGYLFLGMFLVAALEILTPINLVGRVIGITYNEQVNIIQDGTTPAIMVSGGTNPWIKVSDGITITKLQTKTGGAGIVGTDTESAFEIRTGNIVRMTFAANGNVGIGTENPTAKLQVVEGEVKFPAEGEKITHFNYAPDSRNYIRGTTILADLDSGEKVGIGTQTPTAKLHVKGNAIFEGNVNVQGQVLVQKVCFRDGSCIDGSSLG